MVCLGISGATLCTEGLCLHTKGGLVMEDQWLAGSILEVPLERGEKRDCSQDLGASTTDLGPKPERPWVR